MLLELSEEHPLYELPLRCTKTEFFVCLVSEIKKSSLWAQKVLIKNSREKINIYEQRLEVLKNNFEDNFSNIFSIERKIQQIKNNELVNKLRDLRIFECLNAEKAMPHFLNIAKKTKSEAELSEVKNDDGSGFETDQAREAHICNFYGDLYKINLQLFFNFLLICFFF